MKIQAGTIVWRMKKNGTIMSPIKILKIDSDNVYYYNMFGSNNISAISKDNFKKFMKDTVPYISNYEYNSVTTQEKIMLINYIDSKKMATESGQRQES